MNIQVCKRQTYRGVDIIVLTQGNVHLHLQNYRITSTMKFNFYVCVLQVWAKLPWFITIIRTTVAKCVCAFFLFICYCLCFVFVCLGGGGSFFSSELNMFFHVNRFPAKNPSRALWPHADYLCIYSISCVYNISDSPDRRLGECSRQTESQLWQWSPEWPDRFQTPQSLALTAGCWTLCYCLQRVENETYM